MLKCLEALQSRYKVRVCQPNSSYTLDLVRCFDILTKVHDAKKMELYGLHNFMENKPVKASEWLVCAQDYDQNLNVLVGH